MGIKMVLSGEGADEIFAGYLYFHKCPNPEEMQAELKDKIRYATAWEWKISIHLFWNTRLRETIHTSNSSYRIRIISCALFYSILLHYNNFCIYSYSQCFQHFSSLPVPFTTSTAWERTRVRQLGAWRLDPLSSMLTSCRCVCDCVDFMQVCVCVCAVMRVCVDFMQMCVCIVLCDCVE